MHISSDDVLKAKTILGDRNAELIAQILGLPDYDEKNKKACCPYHNEDTPSFIYPISIQCLLLQIMLKSNILCINLGTHI